MDEKYPYSPINEHELTEEFSKLPGYVAYFGAKLSEAKEDMALAKLNVEKVESVIITTMRASEEAKNKKPSVDALNHHAHSQTAYVTASLEFISAEKKKNDIQAILEALHARREMLISLGAHLREEQRLLNSNFKINR